MRLTPMSVRAAARRNAAALAGAALAGLLATGMLVTGCSGGPTTPPRPSVDSCTVFGIHALEHHTTVTSLPAACRGLTPTQVNFAVGRALYAVSSNTVHGKAARRARAAQLSPLLAHLVTTVPAPSSRPVVAAAPPPHRASRFPLGFATLATWLITVALGSWMMSRWIAHGGLRRAVSNRGHRPLVNFAHFGLAVTGLLAWIVYLATGLAGVAWAACVLLLPVAGLGMALLSLWLPERSPVTAPAAVQPVPVGADAAPAPAGADPPPARHQPVLTVATHAGFAVVTMLLALLAAIGAS
jgi:hypothetical protein